MKAPTIFDRAMDVWSSAQYRNVMLPGLGARTCGEFVEFVKARPSPDSPEIEGLVERLNERWEKIPGASMRKINRILGERKEAASAISRLSEISTRQSADLDHAERVRVEAEAERDEARRIAKAAHAALALKETSNADDR